MLDNWPRDFNPTLGHGPVQHTSLSFGSVPTSNPLPQSSHSDDTSGTAESTGAGQPSLTFTSPTPTGSGGASSGSLAISSMQPVQTSPPGSSSPALIWSFDAPSNATTCEPFTITWNLNTPLNLMAVDVMTLYIDNNNDTHKVVNLTIDINVPLLEERFTWSAVTVPPGSYVIQGIQTEANGTSGTSPPFSVQAGTNTSCITSTGASLGSTLNVHHPTKTAAIAGGVVGGLVLLACLAMAAFFIHTVRRRRQPKRARTGRGGWGGLDSVDLQPNSSLDFKPHSPLVGLNARAIQVSSFEAGSPGSVRSSLDGEKIAPAVAPRENMEPGLDPGSPTSVELAHLSSSNRSHRSSVDMGNEPVMSTPSAAQNPRRASRTPRKPVPSYDPTPEELNVLSMARSHSAHSTASQLSSSPTVTTTTITASATQSYNQRSSSVSEHKEALLEGLKSKSGGTYDNQRMHYLIPDMPPPPRD